MDANRTHFLLALRRLDFALAEQARRAEEFHAATVGLSRVVVDLDASLRRHQGRLARLQDDVARLAAQVRHLAVIMGEAAGGRLPVPSGAGGLIWSLSRCR